MLKFRVEKGDNLNKKKKLFNKLQKKQLCGGNCILDSQMNPVKQFIWIFKLQPVKLELSKKLWMTICCKSETESDTASTFRNVRTIKSGNYVVLSRNISRMMIVVVVNDHLMTFSAFLQFSLKAHYLHTLTFTKAFFFYPSSIYPKFISYTF